MKGRTKWFKRDKCLPVRPGVYECGVIITSAQRNLFLMKLEFDGVGFLVDVPLIRVVVWRGMTKTAHDSAMSAGGDHES